MPMTALRLMLVAIAIYAAVWLLFRAITARTLLARRVKTHQKEWQRRIAARTAIEHAPNFDARAKLEPDENIAILKWEADHGALRSTHDLKEEWRRTWSFVHMFQGALATAGTVLIATVVFGSRGSQQAVNLTGIERRLQAIEQRLPDDWGTPPPAPILWTGGFFALCLAAGVAFYAFSKNDLGKAAGMAIALTGTAFSGAKLLGVEKMFDVDKIVSIEWAPRGAGTDKVPPPVAAPHPTSAAVRFEAFPDGKVEPPADLQCAARAFASFLRADPDVINVTVVGRADRRELRNPLRKRFGTNWALAQQRAGVIERLFAEAAFAPDRVNTVAAGPLLTDGYEKAQDMERDREITVYVNLVGDPRGRPWFKLEDGYFRRRCGAR